MALSAVPFITDQPEASDSMSLQKRIEQTRVEQMNAVAQSLQAAAMALQRVAIVNPSSVTAQPNSGSQPEATNEGIQVERDATVARLVGAAQRVRADWSGNDTGVLSQLSRENAALREALNDTTRKLNELEVEKVRSSDAAGSTTVTSDSTAATAASVAISSEAIASQVNLPAEVDEVDAAAAEATDGCAVPVHPSPQSPSQEAATVAAAAVARVQAVVNGRAHAAAEARAALVADVRAALVEAVSAAQGALSRAELPQQAKPLEAAS
jgi:hypothetical protein